MSTATPAVVDLSFKLLGVADGEVRLELPLLPASRLFALEATIGPPSSPAVFNRAFVPLAGIEVSGGRVGSTSIGMVAEDWRSVGKVRVAYRDLAVDVVHGGDEDESRKRPVASFLANLRIRSSNPSDEDEPPAPGERMDGHSVGPPNPGGCRP